MLNNLTELDQLVLASIAGGMLGGVLSGLVYEAIDIAKQRVDDKRTRYRKILDTILVSVGLGLAFGAATFASGSFAPRPIQYFTPSDSFFIGFIGAGMASFLEGAKLIYANFFKRGKSD